ASGPSKEQWSAVESMFQSAKRPLFLIGAAGFGEERLSSILRLSEKTGYPILAENASGLPFLKGTFGGYVVRQLDSVLAEIAKGNVSPPDLLVRLGTPL